MPKRNETNTVVTNPKEDDEPHFEVKGAQYDVSELELTKVTISEQLSIGYLICCASSSQLA